MNMCERVMFHNKLKSSLQLIRDSSSERLKAIVENPELYNLFSLLSSANAVMKVFKCEGFTEDEKSCMMENFMNRYYDSLTIVTNEDGSSEIALKIDPLWYPLVDGI